MTEQFFTDTAREAAARAVFIFDYQHIGGGSKAAAQQWELVSEERRDLYRARMDAALTALGRLQEAGK